VSKVLATGLTDFDDDSESEDELQQHHQQQQQQLSHDLHRSSVASQQGGASEGVRGVGQVQVQHGSSTVARAGIAVQGAGLQQGQGDESDEFDF
jgi:hypothetical protein